MSFEQDLQSLVMRIFPQADAISGLRRLSAGATLQTWSFDAVHGTQVIHPLILRRSPGGLRSSESLSLEVEADLIRALAGSGAPVAHVVHTLVPADSLGDGFLMTRIEGETIPRKILRDEMFAEVRPALPAQFGRILAAIHRVDTRKIDALPSLKALPMRPASVILQRMLNRYEAQGIARPVFDVAFRWLSDHLPEDPPALRLVHGDFRNGNLIFGSEGVRAVLDWEVAHFGDPAEDLAWVCAPPWRFGEIDKPVGGLGSRDALYAAYEDASGEKISRERTHFWEVMGSMRWGMGCAGMLDWFASGRDPSVERAMIARRVSENELDLLRIINGRH